MEYVLIVVILVVAVYMLTRKKKEKPPVEQAVRKEEEKEKKTGSIEVNPLSTEQKVYWIKDGKKEWGTLNYMPQGLQVFDENGNIVVDITDRLMKVLGVVELKETSGEITDNRLKGQEMWVSIVRETDNVGKNFEVYEIDSFSPHIERKGNTIVWTGRAPYFISHDTWNWGRYSTNGAELLNIFNKHVKFKMIYGVY